MRSAAGKRALLAACTAALAALALARRSCNTATFGLQRGREVHVEDQRMAPATPDWNIRVPQVCNRVLGVSATACDADGAPAVYLSSATRGLVMRGSELNTGAYLYVTVFCDPDEEDPELLEMSASHSPPRLQLTPSNKLPWLQSQSVVPISPDRLVVLSPPQWPKISPFSSTPWREQPVILGLQPVSMPGPQSLLQTLFPPERPMSSNSQQYQNGRLPLRHPKGGTLQLSRSPTTDFPEARWAVPDPVPELVPEPVSEQRLELEPQPELEPESEHDHDPDQRQEIELSPETGNVQEQQNEIEHEAETGPESEQNVDGLQTPESVSEHALGTELGTVSAQGAGERPERWPMRPLSLMRKIAQWWTKYVRGGARALRRAPRRRATRLLASLRSFARRHPTFYWRV